MKTRNDNSNTPKPETEKPIPVSTNADQREDHSDVSTVRPRSLASSPLVVTLLILLVTAVMIQTAALLVLYNRSEAEEVVAVPADDAPLVAKPSDQDAVAPATPAAPTPTSPLASPFTDFFADDWQPFAEMARMRERMDRMFDESFGRFRAMPGFDDSWLDLDGAQASQPAIDEKDGSYTITLEIPGADESTLDVRIEDNLLTVSGQREEINEEADTDDNVRLRSRSSNSFRQSFTLPGPVDVAGMTTDYAEGVLTVTVPKQTA